MNENITNIQLITNRNQALHENFSIFFENDGITQ
jgi:hypothetical protein